MIAKPKAQKASPAMQKSMKFFERMLTVLRRRANPDSTKAKPACMKKTKNAATSVQAILTEPATASSSSWVTAPAPSPCAIAVKGITIAPAAPPMTASLPRPPVTVLSFGFRFSFTVAPLGSAAVY